MALPSAFEPLNLFGFSFRALKRLKCSRSTVISNNLCQGVLEQWRGQMGVAVFKIAGNDSHVANATHRLPLLVPLAQRVRMLHASGGDGGESG